MHAFVITGTAPHSANASGRPGRERRRLWKERVRSFRPSGGASAPIEGPLYAAVYYFHSRPTGLDADNLSKPILDALQGLAYEDDRQVKLRHAGTFDLSVGFDLLDTSRLPQAIFDDLIEAVNGEEHTVYVEIGRLHYTSHFRFGREIPS